MAGVSYNFANEVAFVTGALGGMGKAVARAFVHAGASVLMCDLVGPEEGARLAAEAVAGAPAGSGGRFEYVSADVSDDAAMQAAVARCVASFGALDHAVNAAAIENETAPLHECSAEKYHRMMAVNVDGIFFSMKHQLGVMLNSGRAGQTIVNIASTNSVRPHPNQPAYTAAKHAVLGITRSAAVDYAAHGIRVNAILPGSIDTPMLRNAMERRGRNPQDVANRLSLLQRFGTPEEIAEAALWLSSPGSSFTLGHSLGVDAGYLSR